jgi:hypothetical protein
VSIIPNYVIFQKLYEFNLKTEQDKCGFLKEELNYLGHVVTAESVKPDDRKIEAVVKFPIPQSQKDVIISRSCWLLS